MKLYNYISFIFYTFQFNIMKPFIIFYFLFFMVSRSLSFVHHHVGCILLRMHSRKKGMLLNDGAFRNCFCDLVSIESQSSDGLNHKRTSWLSSMLSIDVGIVLLAIILKEREKKKIKATWWNKRKEIIARHKKIRLPRMFYYSTFQEQPRWLLAPFTSDSSPFVWKSSLLWSLHLSRQ